MAMIRPWFLLGAVLAAPSALAQTAGTVALENDYVRVSKDAVPCAAAPQPQPARRDPSQQRPAPASMGRAGRQGHRERAGHRQLARADHPHGEERRRHAAAQFHSGVLAGEEVRGSGAWPQTPPSSSAKADDPVITVANCGPRIATTRIR